MFGDGSSCGAELAFSGGCLTGGHGATGVLRPKRLAPIGHLGYCRSQVQMRRWDAGDVQNGVLGEQPVVERGHALAVLLSDLPQRWTPFETVDVLPVAAAPARVAQQPDRRQPDGEIIPVLRLLRWAKHHTSHEWGHPMVQQVVPEPPQKQRTWRLGDLLAPLPPLGDELRLMFVEGKERASVINNRDC